MVQLPAKCVNPRCGYIDSAPGAVEFGGDSTQNNVVGVSFDRRCRKCGSKMVLVEGTFSTRDDRLHLDAGPQWTKDVLHELEDALEFARDNFFTDPDEAVRRISAASPSLGRAVMDAMSGRYALGAYGLIGAICAVVMMINSLLDDDDSEARPQEAPTVITNVFQVQQSCRGAMTEEEISEAVRREFQRLHSGPN